MLRRIVLAVSLTAAVGLSFVPIQHTGGRVTASSFTCPANAQCGFRYYSDAAHTNEIGYSTIFCNGAVSSWGTQSGNPVWWSLGCNGKPPV